MKLALSVTALITVLVVQAAVVLNWPVESCLALLGMIAVLAVAVARAPLIDENQPVPSPVPQPDPAPVSCPHIDYVTAYRNSLYDDASF